MAPEAGHGSLIQVRQVADFLVASLGMEAAGGN
jgi:hypothetical protein